MRKCQCSGGPEYLFQGWGSMGGDPRVLPRWTTPWWWQSASGDSAGPRAQPIRAHWLPCRSSGEESSTCGGEGTKSVNRACSPTPACWLWWREGLIFFLAPSPNCLYPFLFPTHDGCPEGPRVRFCSCSRCAMCLHK